MLLNSSKASPVSFNSSWEVDINTELLLKSTKPFCGDIICPLLTKPETNSDNSLEPLSISLTIKDIKPLVSSTALNKGSTSLS